MVDILSNLSKEQLTHIVKVFDIQIAIVIVLLAFVTRTIFAKLVIKVFRKIFKINNTSTESGMFGTLKFIYVFFFVYIASKILPLSNELQVIREGILEAIIILFMAKTANTIIFVKDSRFFKNAKGSSNNETVNEFICKVIRVVVWLISFYIIFTVWGFELNGLITGLGVGTIIISLAAQDTVKSLLSGVSILTDKPFVIGDWIEVGEFQGTVIDITFRSTRIKAYNNAVVTIPNSTITSTYVVNWNRLTSRRFDCVLNISLETSSEKIKKIVKEMKLLLQNDPKVIKETVEVTLDNISSCSNDIKIFLYVRESEYNKFLKAKQDILCSLLYLVEKENIDLAYPTQTVYVKNQIK